MGPAALAELVGTWLAHPIPGRRFRTQQVAFDPGLVLERSRLFLLIALGGAILTTGTAVAEQPVTAGAALTPLLFGGPLLDLAVQGLYLRLVTSERSVIHLIGVAGLSVLVVAGIFMPVVVATALLTLSLVRLAIGTRNLRRRVAPT